MEKKKKSLDLKSWIQTNLEASTWQLGAHHFLRTLSSLGTKAMDCESERRMKEIEIGEKVRCLFERLRR